MRCSLGTFVRSPLVRGAASVPADTRCDFGVQRPWCGDNGAALWTGREMIPGPPHFVTILVAGDPLYIAQHGPITAFTWATR